MNPKAKMALGMGLVAFVATVMLLSALGVLKDEPSTSKPRTPAAVKPLTGSELACPGSAEEVRYVMGGTASRMNYTIETPTGSEQGVTVGTSKTFCFPARAFHYLSLQNDTEFGTVECSIEVDGLVVSQNKSAGAFVIAGCDD